MCVSQCYHHYDLHSEVFIWWAGFCHCIILDWCNLNSPFTGHIMVMREWRLRVSCFYPPTIAHLIDTGTSIHRGSSVVKSSRLLASMDLSKILYNVPASIPINRNLLSLRHPSSNYISLHVPELVGLDAQKLNRFLSEAYRTRISFICLAGLFNTFCILSFIDNLVPVFQ